MSGSVPADDRRLAGPVRIVGTGLLGTSIGLALSERGVDVSLADASPASLALAVDYGAGRPAGSTTSRGSSSSAYRRM